MLPRKTVLLAKIESVYGTDAAPVQATNAILARNLKVTPLRVETEKTDWFQGYLGNTPDIPVLEECMTEFEVLLSGSGAAGTAPKWGPLMRACQQSETLLAADFTGTCAAGSTSTATLPGGASAVNGFYNGMVFDATGGTGSGQSSIIVDYDGATKIATFAAVEPIAYSVTTTFAIRANAIYRPISSGFEAVTIYHYRDGVLYKGLGVRGSVAIAYAAKKLPVARFKFVCLYSPVTDAALPTAPDFTGFQTVRPSIPTWTPEMAIHTYAAKVASVDLDQAGDIQHMVWMNAESVDAVDRKPAGKMTVEAVTIATKDYFNALRQVTLGTFGMRHGTAIGNSIVTSAPQLQISGVEETLVNGVLGFDLTTTFQPKRGNDEYTICVM